MEFWDPDHIRKQEDNIPKMMHFPNHKRITVEFTVGGAGTVVEVKHDLPPAFITDIPSKPIRMRTTLHVSFDTTHPAYKDFFIIRIHTTSTVNYNETTVKRVAVCIVAEEDWKVYTMCRQCGNFLSHTRFVFPLNFPEYAICQACYDMRIRKGEIYEGLERREVANQQHSEVKCVPKTIVSCRNNSQHEADCFCLKCDKEYCFQDCKIFICHACRTTTHRFSTGYSARSIMYYRAMDMKETLWRLTGLEEEFRSIRYVISVLGEENREEALKHIATLRTWRVGLFLDEWSKYEESKLRHLAKLTDEKLGEIKRSIEDLSIVVKQKKDAHEGLRLLSHAMPLSFKNPEEVYKAARLPMNKPDDTCKRTSSEPLQLESSLEKKEKRMLKEKVETCEQQA
ncbi:hypothetical protein CAEBREN_05888 [Caenorhabditis brenneri]|uniref:Uncharacterized protein n=1 Tax=Caenorhabditis brenneri TaxID=135651 RepID=G0MQT0_CAEBE|nr:hypothetical protein CAEBREN_05888 [Caenorhabditis brenneri]